MISKETFIKNVLAIQQRFPTYREGGVGSDGTCDCIGLIMGAMYEAGHKKYDMHSTNYFARYQMQNLYAISRPEHLFTGMIVYKATEDTSDLNARYQPGGRYYTGDMLDYYHVGVVLSANPLTIIHCTSGGGVDGITTDHSMGKWAFGGMLKDINYGSADEPASEEETMVPYKAKVTAPSGSTVNMRVRPNPDAARLAKVPIGDIVEVQTEADGWARIDWNGTIGYMMSQYLLKVAFKPGSTESVENELMNDLVVVRIPRSAAEALMRAFTEVL